MVMPSWFSETENATNRESVTIYGIRRPRVLVDELVVAADNGLACEDRVALRGERAQRVHEPQAGLERVGDAWHTAAGARREFPEPELRAAAVIGNHSAELLALGDVPVEERGGWELRSQHARGVVGAVTVVVVICAQGYH